MPTEAELMTDIDFEPVFPPPAAQISVLAIEDNQLTADLLIRTLSRSGYRLEVCGRGAEGLEMLTDQQFDVVLLDLTLPDMDGLNVCRELRTRGDNTPILMLSARDQLHDRVEGLRIGADDYLTKPFKTVELEARIQALVRRASASNPAVDVLKVGDLHMDIPRRTVTRAGDDIFLTPKEFALLEILMRHPGEVISADQLYQRVWGGRKPDTNVVQVALHQLRRKLSRGQDSLIETVRGFGYRLRER
jgi:DNA-binding response OmpR family regulator